MTRRSSPRGTARRRISHEVLAARLTPRDRWLIRMLAEHRVLTTHHFVTLAFPSPRAAQLRLATLASLRVISSFQPLRSTGAPPKHWVLTTIGAEVLSAEDGHPPHERREQASAIAHNRQLRHQLGVNTCLTSLAKATLTCPHSQLRAWWGQARCTRRVGDHIRPDAYALLTHAAHRLPFFLEYDTGTEALHRLAAKLSGYHRLASTTAITTPILFWLPNPTRESHARDLLAHALADLPEPHRTPMATTYPHTGSHRSGNSHPPGSEWTLHTPAWAPLHAEQSSPGIDGYQRVSLTTLAARWNPAHPRGTHYDTASAALTPPGLASRPRGRVIAHELAPPHPTPPAPHTPHPAFHPA